MEDRDVDRIIRLGTWILGASTVKHSQIKLGQENDQFIMSLSWSSLVLIGAWPLSLSTVLLLSQTLTEFGGDKDRLNAALARTRRVEPKVRNSPLSAFSPLRTLDRRRHGRSQACASFLSC